MKTNKIEKIRNSKHESMILDHLKEQHQPRLTNEIAVWLTVQLKRPVSTTYVRKLLDMLEDKKLITSTKVGGQWFHTYSVGNLDKRR